jgi:hypothetical protein
VNPSPLPRPLLFIFSSSCRGGRHTTTGKVAKLTSSLQIPQTKQNLLTGHLGQMRWAFLRRVVIRRAQHCPIILISRMICRLMLLSAPSCHLLPTRQHLSKYYRLETTRKYQLSNTINFLLSPRSLRKRVPLQSGLLRQTMSPKMTPPSCSKTPQEFRRVRAKCQ